MYQEQTFRKIYFQVRKIERRILIKTKVRLEKLNKASNLFQ